MPTALICGGGVAGLSSALHLKRDGWRVRLFEKDAELRTAGVGLNIWPNGVRVLQGLGLGECFLAEAASMNRWWTLDSDGTRTSDTDVSSWPDELGAPITGARRRRLNAMLAAGLDTEEIVFGATAETYQQDGEQITLHLADGRRATGDLLLGTDGIGSRIRTRVLGARPAFTDPGLYRWRGVFACAEAGVPTDVQADVFGPTGHFGWIPIDATHAYWYGTLDGLTTLEQVSEVYSSWSGTPVPAIIAASEPASLIGREITHYRSHLPRWSDGRALLVGDSAHPMFPGMAQGANQALIDGQTLARCLREHPDVPTAVAAFERERLPVANKMVDYSRLHFDYTRTREEYAAGRGNLQIQRYLEFE
ncbi:FAD-dependent monooxygenase [Desertihabitans brevis]|uniref:FAD-dependent monooxygenase n=1 Tax=Desertihabitans brevis TaxID=2268447 RepID=A0A367Z276_9ACTN|nr:NAD(P)/FAD-dependent oxidoreductase [Desertihabitans brevis]RCK71331.1 FAD-dependent monooxygenase [Desertihabitans brevis]